MQLGLNLLALRSRRPVGVERFVRNVVGHLRLAENTQSRVALPRRVDKCTALGKEFFLHNPDTTVSYWPTGGTVTRVLMEMFLLSFAFFRCDVVFSANNFGPLFGKRSQKRIVVIHDVWFLSTNYNGAATTRVLFKFLLKLQIATSHRIVTVSRFSRNAIAETMKVDPAGVTIVSNCLEDGEMTEVDRDTGAIPDAFFLLIGSDRPNKNVLPACEAFARYRRETRDAVSLLLVGSYAPTFVDQLHRRIPEAGAVGISIPGYVGRERLLMLLRMAKGVVFPSLYEGFGIPVLEALAAGKPIMISQGTACEELAGPMGIVVDGESMRDIVRGYKNLAAFRNPLSEAELRQMVSRFYDCQACADALRMTLA